ncbi:MAG: HesA/MoeB/ThiF family protein [Candidatus Bathyarchaeota archaeon]|jgi:adenylyltransferase/sulfurtransferase|nr:HesA/MoeB/ThiF family protein [Candidatus Bathyarchaeota archaeon]
MDSSEKNNFAAEFYIRQAAMKEFGSKEQKKLSKSKVAVVGIGGLGTVSSVYLALAGVGKLRLIDQDTVELKNLHRQILYKPSDLHYPKAEIASNQLEKMNPLLQAEAVSENINSNNVDELLEGVDCVVDGLDNMSTRYLINRTCVKMKIPYVFGAAIGLEGNLSVFAPPDTGCLMCLLPNVSDEELMTCETRGVVGATPGIIGSMQAMEAIKLLTGIGSPLKGKLMVCDFSDMYFTTIDISKSAKCPVCQIIEAPRTQTEKLVWLCGRETANINPKLPLNLDLNELAKLVKKNFKLRLKSHLAIIFYYNGLEVSLFKGGRMLIKNVDSEKAALNAYRKILKKLKIDSNKN